MGWLAANVGVVLLAAPAALRDVRFRRLGDRLATWVMVAGMHPVPALAAAEGLTLRHLQDLPLDAAYLATVSALQR